MDMTKTKKYLPSSNSLKLLYEIIDILEPHYKKTTHNDFNIFKVNELIIDYTIKTPLMTRGNNNLIGHIINIFIDAMVMSNKDKVLFSSFLCCKKRRLDMVFIANHEITKDQLTHDIENGRMKIFNYILNNSYFNELTLNKSYYVASINDNNFTYLSSLEQTNIAQKKVNVSHIRQIDLSNKYDILYDIFIKNDIYYLFSIELIQLRVGKMKNNATMIYNDCKKCDLLLYAFIDNFDTLYNELSTTPNESDEERIYMKNFEDNTIIYGVYKIKLQQLNKKNYKHLHKIAIINNKDNRQMINNDCYKVSSYLYKTNSFNNNYRHTYSFYITKNEQPKQKTDEELIKLFCEEPKKPTKPNKILPSFNSSCGGETPQNKSENESISEDESTSEEERQDIILQDLKLNINYHPRIINKSKIYDILYNLIINNYRFEKEYLQYGFIYVSKDYDKDYTNTHYINFCFENDGYVKGGFIRRSKTYHGYLTKDLNEIKNLSYIENINLI